MYRKHDDGKVEASSESISKEDLRAAPIGYWGGDCVPFHKSKYYDTQTKLLFDVRRLLRTLVILYFIPMVILIVIVSALWAQLAHYELLSRNNMNSMNNNIMDILRNVDVMTTSAVPIVENTALATNATAFAILTVLNKTSSPSPTPAGRHLLAVSSEDNLAIEDYKTRAMIYQQVHGVMKDTRGKLEALNVSAINFAIESFGDVLQWVVHGIDYKALGAAYDRTLGDMERTANFGLLFTSVLGIAAAAANVTAPSVMSLIGTAAAGMG